MRGIQSRLQLSRRHATVTQINSVARRWLTRRRLLELRQLLPVRTQPSHSSHSIVRPLAYPNPIFLPFEDLHLYVSADLYLYTDILLLREISLG